MSNINRLINYGDNNMEQLSDGKYKLKSYFFIFFLYLEMNFEWTITDQTYSSGYMSISSEQPTCSYNLYNFIQIFYSYFFI
jgi:hypothetical protein